MDIIQIETLVSGLVTSLGYSPKVASEEQLNGSVEAMPMAWIELPKVLYVEGRKEGVIGHQVSFSLIDDFRGFSPEQQGERLAEMQQDALEVVTRLSLCDGVVEVDKVTVAPRRRPTTFHDNIAQVCLATVISYF